MRTLSNKSALAVLSHLLQAPLQIYYSFKRNWPLIVRDLKELDNDPYLILCTSRDTPKNVLSEMDLYPAYSDVHLVSNSVQTLLLLCQSLESYTCTVV